MRAATKRRIRKSLWRNWGYLVLAAVIYGWFIADQRSPILLLIGSGLVVIFALFFATTPCGVENKTKRKGGEIDYCDNNGHGLLGACDLAAHRGKKLMAKSAGTRTVRAIRFALTKFSGQAAAFSAAAGILSAIVATVTLVLTRTAPLPPR